MAEEEYREINKKLSAILKILNGNGEIGLCAKVNFLWGTFVFLLGVVTVQAIILTRILMT